MGKYTIRAKMRELKPTGLKLLERKKVAKAIIRGYGLEETLRALGFKLVSAVPCCEDQCDPYAFTTWERSGRTIRTTFGCLDVPII